MCPTARLPEAIPANGSATDASEMLQKFTRRLAHNLSNPLAAIVGCAQLLERMMRDGAAIDAVQCRAYAAMIEREAQRCSEMLDSLILVARPPAPQTRSLDANALVRKVAACCRCPETISLILDMAADEPVIAADADLLARALGSVLKNAVEAVSDGGAIHVRTECVVDDQRWLRITVADTGPGIPREILDRVTEPFFTTREGHNGIGLAACAQIVARHGGRMRVASETPGGARVSLDFPC